MTEKACGDTDQPNKEPTEMSSFTEEEMVQDAQSSSPSSSPPTKTKQKQRQKQKCRVAAPASVGKQYELGSTTTATPSNGVTRIACRYKKNSSPRKQDKQDDKGRNDKEGKSQRRGSISLEKISFSTMPSGGLSASVGDIKINPAEITEDEQQDSLTPHKAAAVHKAGNWLSKSSRKLARVLTNSTGTSKDTTTPASPHANKEAAKTQALTECPTPSKKKSTEPHALEIAAAGAGAFPSTTPTTPDRRPRIQQLNRGGDFKRPKTPTSSAKPSYMAAGMYLDSFEDEYQSILCEFGDSTRALAVKSEDPHASLSPIVVESTALSLSLSSPLGENHDQDTEDDIDRLPAGPPLVQKEQPDQRRKSIGGNSSWHHSMTEGLLNAYDDIIDDDCDGDDDSMAAADAPPPPPPSSNPPSPPSPSSQQQLSTPPPSTVQMLAPPIEV